MRNNESLHDLSFSQRYGYEALPKPMQSEGLSEGLRRAIWNETRRLLISDRGANDGDDAEFGCTDRYYFRSSTMERLVERVIGKYEQKLEEEISTNYERIESFFRNVILEEKFNKTLDFVEILINDTDELLSAEEIQTLFEQHGAAYRLDTTRFPYRFFPCANKEQCDATQIAIETLQNSSMSGASTHLRRATSHLNNQQFSDSIANSIKAVESVALLIDQSAKTLGPALASLEKKGILKHTALKEAFKKLYGYASDEKGIRHALTNKGNANVGRDEAVFMFGACASFAAYLANKHQQLQQQTSRDS